MTPWEENREANIRRNRALLAEMGLDKPFFEPKEKRQPKMTVSRKRKAASSEDESEAPPKVVKMIQLQSPAEGPRRSGRNVGKSVDYKAAVIKESPVSLSVKGRSDGRLLEVPARSLFKRIHDPKTFGHIPGVPVGTWWETREACSVASIHAPWVAGISGSNKGAWSVCLSGGYEDDVDMGYGFTFTGSGGRDLRGTVNAPKNLRTAPQSCDQSWENSGNKALKISSETGRPVRVVRGYKSHSRYAPYEGYRYDGLYRVEKAWMAPGLNEKRYLVCKFAFKRLDNQLPLPVWGDEDGSESALDEEPTSGSQGNEE